MGGDTMGRWIRGAVVTPAVWTGRDARSGEASADEEVLRRAQAWIRKAEARLRPDTEARITRKLTEAKGTLESAEISARQTVGSRAGLIGRYSFSDAALQVLWAESLAREVVFLTTG
jgi:hypothetical protein